MSSLPWSVDSFCILPPCLQVVANCGLNRRACVVFVESKSVECVVWCVGVPNICCYKASDILAVAPGLVAPVDGPDCLIMMPRNGKSDPPGNLMELLLIRGVQPKSFDWWDTESFFSALHNRLVCLVSSVHPSRLLFYTLTPKSASRYISTNYRCIIYNTYCANAICCEQRVLYSR
jgi:hypothetical protein